MEFICILFVHLYPYTYVSMDYEIDIKNVASLLNFLVQFLDLSDLKQNTQVLRNVIMTFYNGISSGLNLEFEVIC